MKRQAAAGLTTAELPAGDRPPHIAPLLPDYVSPEYVPAGPVASQIAAIERRAIRAEQRLAAAEADNAALLAELAMARGQKKGGA